MSSSSPQSTEQNIGFSEDFSTGNYKVLELSEEALQLLQSEGSFTLKGGAQDEAVLCTSQRTFSLKLVESTNTHLLLRSAPSFAETQLGSPQKEKTASATAVFSGPVAASGQVLTAFSHTYTLEEMQPQLGRVRQLLAQALYRGREHDKASPPAPETLFSLSRLRQVVQASESALQTELTKLGALEIDGYCRMFDVSYLRQLLDALLTEATLNDWDLRALNGDECVQIMQRDYPRECVLACLSHFGTQDSTSSLWALSEQKVCLYRASQLLAVTQSWDLPNFLEEWENNVPIGFKPNLEMLQGIAFVTEELGASTISHLPEHTLSSEPRTRLKELLSKKKVWTATEIKPYLQPVLPPNTALESFLLKFARAQNLKTGVKGYSLK